MDTSDISPPPTQTDRQTKGKKIKAWIKRHQVAIAIITGSLVVAGVFLLAIGKVNIATTSLESTKPKPKPIEKVYSLLTGEEVADEAAQKQPVTAVMIENSPDARPQSGLKGAGVVYEAVAEGGITRFLAVYQHNKPELIGPVRSLRIYYLDWAAPYQASIAHVGGSYNALDTVKNYRDIDQSFNAGSYWRATDRYAPHNVYTSGANLDALNASKSYSESVFESFPRTDGKPAEEPNASSIAIDFSSYLYGTTYAYDQASNTYARSLAGQPHTDREAGQISPSVIVALKVNTQLRDGPDGYEDIVTSGSGEGYVFQNGTATTVSWHKDNRDTPLRLLDADGQPVKLVRGQTWISAITGRGSVSWQ